MKKAAHKTKVPRQTEARSGYQVFVSHATADKWIARMICEKLEQQGAKTFRDDRDINGGDDIPNTLRREIRRSNELLVLMTPESVGRQWVLLEVGAAWLRGESLRIVAVLCHVDIAPIPDILKSKKVVHINDFDQYLFEVAKRVARHSELTR